MLSNRFAKFESDKKRPSRPHTSYKETRTRPKTTDRINITLGDNIEKFNQDSSTNKSQIKHSVFPSPADIQCLINLTDKNFDEELQRKLNKTKLMDKDLATNDNMFNPAINSYPRNMWHREMKSSTVTDNEYQGRSNPRLAYQKHNELEFMRQNLNDCISSSRNT